MNIENHDETLNDLVKLSFFTDIGIAITSSKNLREMLDRIMDHIGTIFMPFNWSLMLKDNKTGDLVFKIAVGEKAEKLVDLRIPKGEGIVGWISENGKPLIIEDVSEDGRFNRAIDEMTGFETKSIIGVPLKVNKKVFGVIELINKLNGDSFSPYELKLLQTIADFAAVAIEKFYYLKALQKMAAIDSLTGVLNRGRFDFTLAKEIERSKRYNYPLSLLMLDIDYFKKINDTHGHQAGDAVLKETAGILKNNIRAVDSVYRYGGDEFAIIMPSTALKEADYVRRRIISEREQLNGLDSVKIPVSYSIGIHSAGPEGLEDIISASDMDLYNQKSRRDEKNYENLNEHVEEFLDEAGD